MTVAYACVVMIITNMDIKALVFAATRQEYRHIASSTCGIVFLGTPFRGSKASSWGVIMTNCASVLGLGSDNRLLKTLKEGSERLDTLLQDFVYMAKIYAMRLECFYETKGTFLGKFGVGAVTIVSYVLARVMRCEGLKMLCTEIMGEVINALAKVGGRW